MVKGSSRLPKATLTSNVPRMNAPTVERNIGLAGAVFTLVGYVIGASIFILPGQLAAEAGPAAVLCYAVAGLLAAISCLAGATIGSTVPVSGAGNVAAARVVAPLAGFMGVWVTLVAVAVSIALVGYGLTDYAAYFVPGLNKTVVALAVTIGFGLLNLANVQLAVWIQVVMTLGFLVVMFAFGMGGALNAKPELLTPFAPNGLGPLATGSVLAYFSYAGITVITEIGGEIKDPGRNIPRTLLIGFLVIMTAYCLVAFAVPALLPWTSLKGVDAPVARAAEVFLPLWVGKAIAGAALLAAATSINGMLLVHSRDVLAMARAKVFPEVFAHRRANTGVPVAAVVLVTALGAICVLTAGTIRQYAMMAVMSVTLLQVSQGLTILRLPSRLPDDWAKPGFRPGAGARAIIAALLIVVSAAFFYIGFADNLRVSLLYLGVVLAGVIYYYARRAAMAKEGYLIDQALQAGVVEG